MKTSDRPPKKRWPKRLVNVYNQIVLSPSSFPFHRLRNVTLSEQTIIGNCTFCSGIVRIRFNVDPNTSVRCPHCQQTSKLGTLLDAAVPELEIVEESPIDEPADDGMAKVTEDGRLVVSPILAKGAKRKRRRKSNAESEDRSSRETISISTRESSQELPGFSITTETALPKTTAVNSQTSESSHHRRSSNRRKSRSSSRSDSFTNNNRAEILKVLAGAMLAFPVAQLLIWWVIQVDPLNLAPTVSKIIPVAVPAKLQAKDQLEEPEKTQNLEVPLNTFEPSDILKPDLDPDNVQPELD